MKKHHSELPRLDKTIVVKTSLRENNECKYWHSKSPAERLRELEINRKLIYGYGDNPPRLQKVFEIVKQPWS
jgi:hypothetical protein